MGKESESGGGLPFHGSLGNSSVESGIPSLSLSVTNVESASSASIRSNIRSKVAASAPASNALLNCNCNSSRLVSLTLFVKLLSSGLPTKSATMSSIDSPLAQGLSGSYPASASSSLTSASVVYSLSNTPVISASLASAPLSSTCCTYLAISSSVKVSPSASAIARTSSAST